MSDNPLEASPERDARIKARAQDLWEGAGSPDTGMDDYTERADELIRMEDSAGSGQLPNPMNQPEIIEEASIQENLGEFPGGSSVADQGDWRETPMTRDQLRHGDGSAPDRGDAP